VPFRGVFVRHDPLASMPATPCYFAWGCFRYFSWEREPRRPCGWEAWQPWLRNGLPRRRCDAGDPSRIRTCNPRSRNPLLYPVELWDRNLRTLWLHSTANMKNPLPGQAPTEPFLPMPRQSLTGGPLHRSHRHRRATAGRQPKPKGLYDKCRMRLHCILAPAPRVRHGFRAFLFRTRLLSVSQGAPS
jgi:hypothetical protein